MVHLPTLAFFPANDISEVFHAWSCIFLKKPAKFLTGLKVTVCMVRWSNYTWCCCSNVVSAKDVVFTQVRGEKVSRDSKQQRSLAQKNRKFNRECSCQCVLSHRMSKRTESRRQWIYDYIFQGKPHARRKKKQIFMGIQAFKISLMIVRNNSLLWTTSMQLSTIHFYTFHLLNFYFSFFLMFVSFFSFFQYFRLSALLLHNFLCNVFHLYSFPVLQV